jgi:hypothetical protein
MQACTHARMRRHSSMRICSPPAPWPPHLQFTPVSCMRESLAYACAQHSQSSARTGPQRQGRRKGTPQETRTCCLAVVVELEDLVVHQNPVVARADEWPQNACAQTFHGDGRVQRCTCEAYTRAACARTRTARWGSVRVPAATSPWLMGESVSPMSCKSATTTSSSSSTESPAGVSAAFSSFVSACGGGSSIASEASGAARVGR